MTRSESIIALAAAVRGLANALITEGLADRGVTDVLPAHGAVLHALFMRNPLPMKELAGEIGRKKNTVTSLIRTLEERGYCRRETCSRDGRVQWIHLTEKGEAMRGIQAEVSRTILGAAWRGVGRDEREACSATLAQVAANLRKALETSL